MNNSRTVLIVDEELFGKLLRKVDRIDENLSILNISKKQVLKNNWLTSDEVCSMLSIGKRKLQQMRSDSSLKFTKTGKKIYYKSTDIDKYLENAGK